jgi:hypothetical protein
MQDSFQALRPNSNSDMRLFATKIGVIREIISGTLADR